MIFCGAAGVASWSMISLSWLDVAESVSKVRQVNFDRTKKIVAIGSVSVVVVVSV